jgi:3-chloro-4-hydroxyphenylacetate reductive dehalogenase
MKSSRLHCKTHGARDLAPFPMHKIKKVDQPTVRISAEVQRVDERESAFSRLSRGDFGPKAQQERLRFVQKHPISASLAEMAAHLIPTVDGSMAPEKAPITDDPAEITRHIKEFAYFLRTDLVGICELPDYAIYSYDKDGNKVELDHKYAIVFLIDQDFKTYNGALGYDWISNSQSMLSYSTTAFISCIMASYIRRLGYPARAHHARDYQVLIPPLLLWAGMGEMSRIGIVVNPFLGPRFKAAAVTTNLPLVPDKPIDFGLQKFCGSCMKCARECPAGAISKGGKVIHNGYEGWRANIEACAKFRVLNPSGAGCGRCIKVCPWNKADTWYHRASIWAAQRSLPASKFLIWLDDFLGYGKPVEKDRWWFDLEEVDGKLIVPKRSRGNG